MLVALVCPGVLIFLLAILASANSLPEAFVSDDFAIVRDNPLVQSGDVGLPASGSSSARTTVRQPLRR